MTMRHFLLSVAVLSLLFGTVAANASTITQTFSTGPISSTNARFTFNALQFDPTQGTLNSSTMYLSGSYSVSQDATTHSAQMLVLTSSADSIYYSKYQGGSATNVVVATSSNVTNGPRLGLLTGTGTVPLMFSAFTTGAPLTTSGFSVVLTYDYTPAAVPAVAATPEPASMVLIGTGLIGILGAARRRLV